MEFDAVIQRRRSQRAYLSTPVPRPIVEQLIAAALQAPVSCNLQVTQFVVIDDAKLLATLAQRVSYKFAYAPCCIVVVYDPRVTVERHSVVSSSAMAAEHIILKAVDLGLGTCPMAGFDKDKVVKEVLHIPNELELLLLIAVGYPDESIYKLPVVRVAPTDAYTFNRYDLPRLELSPRLGDHTPASIIDYRRRIASVYLDRFRLHSWPTACYEAVAQYFEHQVLGSNPHQRLLDVMSYDGRFLKELYDRGLANKNHQIIASDYLTEHLNFFQKEFACEGIKITTENSLVGLAQPIDVATMVFQLEFTPNVSALLASLRQCMAVDGTFFLASVNQVFWRRWWQWLYRFVQVTIKRKQFNIYENNPFYKIGPYQYRSPRTVRKLLRQAGFKVQRSGVIRRWRSRGMILRYWLARPE